jgi:tetratricopeptide (TPR) repeat protein
VGAAVKHRKLVIPFRIERDIELSGFAQMMLGTRHFIDVFPEPEARLERFVIETQRSLLAQERSGDRQEGQASTWRVGKKNPNFTGRMALLDELESQLASGNGDGSVVVIYGPPGFGKTELAIEYAYRHRDRYRVACFLPSEQPTTLLDRFSELAPALGLPANNDTDAAVDAVRAELERSNDWLLILDNAEHAEDLERIIPHGGGHIMITSRNRGWRGLGARAAELRIEELTLKEATNFLLARSGEDDEAGALRLSGRLECNPLALDRAGALIDESQMRFSEYLDLLEQDLAHTLEPVLATWTVAFARLETESQEAIELINLLAFLAPDDIPLKELGLPWGAVNVLVKYAHAYRTGDNALSIHRSVQQISRDRLTPEESTGWLDRAVERLLAGVPEDGSDVASWTTFGRLRPHVDAVWRHADSIPTDPSALATLLDRIAVYLYNRALFEQSRQAFDEALRLAERAHGAHHPLVATIRNHIGALLRDLDDLREAQSHHEAALAVHRRTLGEVHPDVATDLYGLGQTLTERGDLAGAREALEQAIAIHTETLGPGHRAVAEDLAALFDALIRSGNLAGARKHLERAAALYTDLYGPDYPDVALAEYLFDLLSGVEAEQPSETTTEKQKLEKLIGVFERAYGADHPKVAELMRLLGDRLLVEKDLEGALECYQRVARIDEDKYRGTHRRVAKDFLRVFSVQAALERGDAARAALTRAWEIFESLGPTEDASVPPAHAALDEALDNLGQISGAIREFEQVQTIVGDVCGADSPAAATVLDYLGAELLEAREAGRARDVHEQALKMLETAYGEDNARVARCLARLAAAQQAVEKPDLAGAKASLERARSIFRSAGDAYRLDLMNTLIALQAVHSAVVAADAARKQRGPTQAEHQAGLQISKEINEAVGDVLGVDALIARAEAQRSEGDLESARQTDEKVLGMVEMTYGANHPDVAQALNRIGTDLAMLGDPSGALERFHRALTIHETEYGPNHVRVAEDLLLNLFRTQIQIGDLASAEPSFTRALGILEGENDPRTAGVRTYGWIRLGDAAVAHQRAGDAQRLYELGVAAGTGPEDLAGQAASHARLAGLAAGRNDRVLVAEHLHTSATLYRESGSSDPFWEVARECSPSAPQQARAALDEALSALRKDPALQEHMRTFHPVLVGSLPGTWFAKESMTLLAPDGQANVIASSEPLDETIDTHHYAEVQGDLLRNEFPGYDERRFEKKTMFGGREGYIREFEWTPPDGVPVTQIQLYYTEAERGFTATATTPSSHFPAVELELRQLLDALIIDQSSPDSPAS